MHYLGQFACDKTEFEFLQSSTVFCRQISQPNGKKFQSRITPQFPKPLTCALFKLFNRNSFVAMLHQAASYFVNFKIASSSFEHTQTLAKMAQKSKYWPILAKNEVAPSRQKQGMLLIKSKIESVRKMVLMHDFFHIRLKLLFAIKIRVMPIL